MSKLENVIIWGDCLQVMPLILSGSIDMILNDLPYGKTENKWDKCLDLNRLWCLYKNVAKLSAALVFTCDFRFACELYSSNEKWFKCEWVWNKKRPSNSLQAKNHPLKVHEYVLIFSDCKVNYFPQDLKVTNKPRGGTKRSKTKNMNVVYNKEYIQKFYNYPKTIIEFGSDNSNNINPTQKPLKLFEYLIKTYTQENEIVLDGAAGSLTTARACLNMNRKFICIEKRLQQIKDAKRKYPELKNIKVLKGKGGVD